jgi:hypothetical protein
MSRARALGVVLAVLLVPAVVSSQRPLPDEESFFAETRQNLARSDREQHRYAYKERRTELHMNPFGRLGTGGMQLFEVIPGSEPGVYQRRLLERDGKPVPGAKAEQQRRRPRPQSRSSIEDVVATLRFTIDRREAVAGRDAIVVRFEPRPDANPQTREGRMARSFKGSIWVDEQAREVTRVEAVATENLSYGLGVIARLGEGTAVSLTRERIDDTVWLPTSIHFKGNGRALLVRKLHIDFGVEWFDYRKVAPPASPPESR